MSFESLKLPYSYEEYSPIISADIMKLHYEKHYIGYMNKLNLTLEKYPKFFNFSAEELLYNLELLPEEIRESVRNNGGGYVNHNLFGEILNPKANFSISEDFEKIIQQEFISLDNLKKGIIQAGMNHFGSGGVGLIVDQCGKLGIYSSSNQDSPFMKGHVPILGVDVGEHSYYLQYKNDKAEYLKNIIELIDGSVVEKKYQIITSNSCTC